MHSTFTRASTRRALLGASIACSLFPARARADATSDTEAHRPVALATSIGVYASVVSLDRTSVRARYATGTSAHTPFDFDIDGSALQSASGGPARTHGAEVDARLGGRWAYLDLGFGVGGGELHPGTFAVGDRTLTNADGAMFVDLRFWLAPGVRVPVGPVAVRADLKLGVEALSLSLDVSDPALHAGAPQAVTVNAFTGTFAPRLSLDVPIGGDCEVTASASYDLVNRAPTFGLAIGLDPWRERYGRHG